MNSSHKIILDKVSLPVHSHPQWKRFPLFSYQIKALDAKGSFMISIPTGFGKTFAGIIPSLVEARHKTFFIFPSNALVETQYNSVKKRLAEWSEEAHTIKLTGDELLIYMLREGYKTKGEALYDLLTQYEKNIIFTNIDIMFNIVALKYSEKYAKDIVPTLKSSRVIFDEFHFYKNITVLLLGALYRILLDFTTDISFLSATPSSRITELLDTIRPIEKIELAEEAKDGDVTITYPVELTVSLPSEDDLQKGMEWLKSQHAEGKLGMAIVDSIRDSIILYRKLKAENLRVFLYNGMLKDEISEAVNEGIIVGTSAIEVGIDKSVDYLFFEAENLTSFLQRFGRVGRHSEGKAFGIVHPEIYNQIAKFPEGSVLPRLKFLNELVSYEYRFNYLKLYLHSEFTPILNSLLDLYDPESRLNEEEKNLLRLLQARDSVSAFILGKREGEPLLITYDILRAIRDYKIKKTYFGSEAQERIKDLDKLSQLYFEYYSQFLTPLILEIEEFTEPSESKLMVKYKEPFIFYPDPYSSLKKAFSSLHKEDLYKPVILNRSILEEGCIRVRDFSDKQKVWIWGFSSRLLEGTVQKGIII